MINLGLAIQAARQEKNLNQEKLAKLVDSSRSTISTLEKTGVGTTKLIDRVAEVLDLTELPMGTRVLRWDVIDQDDVTLALAVAIDILSDAQRTLSTRGVRPSSDAALVDSALGRLLGRTPPAGRVRAPLGASERTPQPRQVKSRERAARRKI